MLTRLLLNGRSRGREMTIRVGIFVGLVVWLLVLPAAAYTEDTEAAGGTGTTLYEISERVTFDPMSVDGHFVIFRNATSPLLGFAEHGTPLCPSTLLITVPKLKRDRKSTRLNSSHGYISYAVFCLKKKKKNCKDKLRNYLKR